MWGQISDRVSEEVVVQLKRGVAVKIVGKQVTVREIFKKQYLPKNIWADGGGGMGVMLRFLA